PKEMAAQIANLTIDAKVRGDWTERNRARDVSAAQTQSNKLLAELTRFGVAAAPLTKRKADFSFSPATETLRSHARYNDKDAALLSKRIEREIPHPCDDKDVYCWFRERTA